MYLFPGLNTILVPVLNVASDIWTPVCVCVCVCVWGLGGKLALLSLRRAWALSWITVEH